MWQTDWKDYYGILQVIPGAEPEVIEGAYKKLASKYHPDNKNTGNDDKFMLIHEAHEILSNPAKKKEYDNAYQYRTRFKDIQSHKRFCDDSSCTGVINENGFCTECKKAYSQEAQREIKERPEKRIIDEDI
ncbi:MAG TPA: DnaJ domain-containing protein [Syntrophales bacterium]|nr:DnaJ domain-containing protein [Syntrophales bacterium]